MSGAVNALNPTTCPAGSGQFTNQTVRNIVYTSVGGDRARIRLSNVFGTAPLTIGDASVAVAETGAETVPGTMRQLEFNGQTSVTIPAGDGVDVPGSGRVTGSVVAFGDSITDGFQSDTNANDRWPNVLARRLDAISGPTLSVVDEGISGNQLLTRHSPASAGCTG